MRRPLEQALERAVQRLYRLEGYRDTARSNAGVVHNPGLLDVRIERARGQVEDLKRRLEALPE